MRPFVPRTQTTILPVATPATRSDWHRASSGPPPTFPRDVARTTGVGELMPFVRVTPGTSSVAPPSAVRWRVDVKPRGPVEAPTVVSQGPPCAAVPASGPLFPADALMEIPAFVASRN